MTNKEAIKEIEEAKEESIGQWKKAKDGKTAAYYKGMKIAYGYSLRVLEEMD